MTINYYNAVEDERNYDDHTIHTCGRGRRRRRARFRLRFDGGGTRCVTARDIARRAETISANSVAQPPPRAVITGSRRRAARVRTGSVSTVSQTSKREVRFTDFRGSSPKTARDRGETFVSRCTRTHALLLLHVYRICLFY